MSNIDIESILQNTRAFKILEDGGHPLECIAELGISLQDHLELYNTSTEYRNKFEIASTLALSIWRAYGREMIVASQDEERTPYDDFNDIAHGRKKQNKKAAADEFQAYKYAVEDLESYIPAIRSLKSGAYYIPQAKEDLVFRFEFISPKPVETEIDE